MASISEDDIRKVREANDIVAVFGEHTPLKQKGRTFWCCCPFHDETTPSCQIDPDAQLWYCFGCGAGGDIFTYVMKLEDISFPDAVRRLAERAGIELTEQGGDRIPRSYKQRLRDLCAETASFYHTQLMRLKSPEADAARAYLASRGLNAEIPKRWELGFAPGNGSLIAHLRSCGYELKEMIDANVVVSYQGGHARDRFFDRIMFPICDESGSHIAFGGRVIGSGEPKYLNSQETPIFHKSNVLYALDRAKASMTSSGTALIVEGYTDVIALHEAGVSNAVATLGTALTKAHLRMLSRHARQRVVYLFDGDEAGQRAADRALSFIDESMTPEAGHKKIDLYACTLPDDLDPAEFVAQRGADQLKQTIDGAQPLIAYGIDRRFACHDLKSAEDRTLAFKEALTILAPIKSSLLAKDYAVQIAARVHIRENDALEALSALVPPRHFETDRSNVSNTSSGMNRARTSAGSSASSQRSSQGRNDIPDESAISLSESEMNRRRFEGEFLRLCVLHTDLAIAHSDSLAKVQWHVSSASTIADAILGYLSKDPSISVQDLTSHLVHDIPDASMILIARQNDAEDAAAYMDFLVEELALGDQETILDVYRSQLKHPEAMTDAEYDMLFETVASMQKDLTRQRLQHTERGTFRS
ncbi:MAG: DNA primase [Eggerthellaceae bacterium]|jgi:DNA primase|nr:DNA primase [Eggerthellaceae bacterium]